MFQFHAPQRGVSGVSASLPLYETGTTAPGTRNDRTPYYVDAHGLTARSFNRGARDRRLITVGRPVGDTRPSFQIHGEVGKVASGSNVGRKNDPASFFDKRPQEHDHTRNDSHHRTVDERGPRLSRPLQGNRTPRADCPRTREQSLPAVRRSSIVRQRRKCP
ncbi:hypothetical protein FRUB_09225 [Fimbriiglobus ruber]|uniref:Uncharacterized protein n=1 Tax=Fimbriiglobus ruber TaxID=1908690 RepID=A0A225D5A5_9BACT|nr:hypothetical protein FRUB_09225 [Fimbriiglobus ruber]